MNQQNMINDDKPVKKFYRSKKNRVLGGVCGGLAEYFEVDVAIMRILFVLLALIKGIGIIIYLVALFVVPNNPDEIEEAKKKAPAKPRQDSSRLVMMIFGVLLIFIGFVYFMENLDIFPVYWFYTFPFHLDWSIFWPLLLILIGIVYLVQLSKEKEIKTPEKKEEKMEGQKQKKLFRSRKDRKIAGVCGGLGAYFNVDSTIVRVLWAVLTIMTSVIFGLIVYIVMAIVVPEGDLEEETPSSSETGGAE